MTWARPKIHDPSVEGVVAGTRGFDSLHWLSIIFVNGNAQAFSLEKSPSEFGDGIGVLQSKRVSKLADDVVGDGCSVERRLRRLYMVKNTNLGYTAEAE